MTTDIERQFFDTFGIEPKLNRPCEQLLQNKYCNENSGSRDTYFDPYPYCVGFENCAKDYKERVWVYPEITDSHYLKMICLIAEKLNCFTNYDIDYKNLKEYILKEMILEKDYFDKRQIQALFKEG